MTQKANSYQLRNIPILCYHNIDADGDKEGRLGHPYEYFKQHLDVIKELGFKTILAQDLFDICTGKQKHDDKYLLLTFDDCHLSQWFYAVPLLVQRDMTGVFFAITDFLVEEPARTIKNAPQLLDAAEAFKLALTHHNYSQFMNVGELTSLLNNYGMEVYSHTSSHRACFRSLKQRGYFSEKAHWTTFGIYPEINPSLPVFEYGSAYAYNGFWPVFDKSSLQRFGLRSDRERYTFCLHDFRKSFKRIKELNHHERQFFCWPWGEFDTLSLQALKETGFTGAFTLERAYTGRGTNPFRLNRILVGRTHTPHWLRRRLSMYSTSIGASIFFKYFRKKYEVKRVLYLTDSTKISGGGRQLLNNIKAMTEYNISTYLLAPFDTPIANALSGTNTTVIPFPHPRQILRSTFLLNRIVKEQNIDVVHTFHSKPAKIGVIAKLLGGRFKLYLNRGVIYAPNPLIGLFASIADGVICNSYKCADILKSYFTPIKKISVIYNSFAGSVSPKMHQIENPLNILYVGNANPVKGYDIFWQTALTYLQQYPDSDIRFIAYGIEKDIGLTQDISSMVLDKIKIYPPVSHGIILQALSEADILLLTSRMESMPNVLLEAFNSSLPVVCTDVGGIKELVQNGINGYLCPSEDVKMLTQRVHDLVSDSESRFKMGKINQKIVEAYLHNIRKGYLLLRVYSGEHITDHIPFQDLAERYN